MVDSELGEIPEGWEVKTINNICETYGGGTPSTKKEEYWVAGDIHWATPSDITSLQSPVIFETGRRINKLGLENSSAKLLPEGTILLTSRATVGLLAVSQVPITTNQGFISIVCEDYPSNYFMYFELKRRKHEIINKASGSTFREINRGTFKKMEVLLPTKALHDKFSEIASLLFEKSALNASSNDNLSKTRNSLLPRLMGGKIKLQ